MATAGRYKMSQERLEELKQELHYPPVIACLDDLLRQFHVRAIKNRYNSSILYDTDGFNFLKSGHTAIK